MYQLQVRCIYCETNPSSMAVSEKQEDHNFDNIETLLECPNPNCGAVFSYQESLNGLNGGRSYRGQVLVVEADPELEPVADPEPDQAPSDQAPSDQAPSDQAPSDQAPSDQAPVININII
jgi:hypothetical protein